MRAAIDEIGGEATLHRLVNRFYDRMENDPEVYELHRLHFRGHGMNHTRQAQFEFLCGFLGGRQYYRERIGHMDLREIHAHIPIRQADIDMWLDTFTKAVEDCGLDGPAVDRLLTTLTRAANILANDLPDWRAAEV